MTALRIVRERPDYDLFENNCQNFVSYLAEEICPGSCLPNTFKHVFEECTTLATLSKRRLPGAYPNSSLSTTTESGMYFTAREDIDDATTSSHRRLMSESESGNLFILSDPHVLVMTVSMEDSMGPALDDLSFREGQMFPTMVKGIVSGWKLQAMIRPRSSRRRPDLQQWEEFTVVTESWRRDSSAYLQLYHSETELNL